MNFSIADTQVVDKLEAPLLYWFEGSLSWDHFNIRGRDKHGA
jgi:hypothetical protein